MTLETLDGTPGPKTRWALVGALHNAVTCVDTFWVCVTWEGDLPP